MTGDVRDSTIASDQGRILVVDDNRINRLLLERRLTGIGFDVQCASGGQEAIDLVREAGEGAPVPFDAVVLDIMMPEVDGMQVLRRIRERYSADAFPVIMATAKDSSEDIVKALREGANDYVTKPVDMPVLIARLRMQVGFRRTHSALKRAQRSLIDAAKMESIGRLAAGVAHEVKNPLYVLQMGVDYFDLITDAEDGPASETLGRMQHAVDRANTIIRGMVDFSRTEELTLVTNDLNNVVAAALRLVDHEARSKGITLESELATGLPEIPLDRTKIEQVIINLVSNACHAMGDGGRLVVRTRSIGPAELESTGIRVNRQLLAAEHLIAIEVEDDGPGIPDGFNIKLFDPFFTTKPAGQGTGLGLSVTKTIVDLHGGHIDITNVEPHGALARVILGNGPPPTVEPLFALDPEAAEAGNGDA